MAREWCCEFSYDYISPTLATDDYLVYILAPLDFQCKQMLLNVQGNKRPRPSLRFAATSLPQELATTEIRK